MNPVIPPPTALTYLGIEQRPGWAANDSSDIGPNPVAKAQVVQVLPPPIQPPMTMTLETQGQPGKWCDAMYTPPPVTIPAGAYSCLIRATVTPNDAINANFELGFRATNQQGITNNGEVQFVPLWNTQYKSMEFDVVPGPSGGWKDTGIRFPPFQVGVANEIELYYTATAENVLSPQYVSLNGDLQAIPESCQNLPSAKQTPPWALLKAVPAFQIDCNENAVPLSHGVTMSIYLW